MSTQVWFGFAALCLLAGSELTLESALPYALPGLFGLAVRLSLFSVLFGVLAWREKRQTLPESMKLAAWGGIAFTSLPIVCAGAGSHVAGLTEILVFTLIPAAVVFFIAQAESGFGTTGSSFVLLGPALAGMGGAALLISYSLPASLAGALWLALMMAACVLTAFTLVRLHGLLRRTRVLPSAALVCAGGTVLAGLFSQVGWTSLAIMDSRTIAVELARILLLDLPVTWLAIWLLGRMAPAAYSARFLLVPFVAVAEAFLIARPAVDWTMYAGSALLLGGSWMLLRSGRELV